MSFVRFLRCSFLLSLTLLSAPPPIRHFGFLPPTAQLHTTLTSTKIILYHSDTLIARSIDVRAVVVEIAKNAGLNGSHAHLSPKLSQLPKWSHHSHHGIHVTPVTYGDISVTAEWVPTTV